MKTRTLAASLSLFLAVGLYSVTCLQAEDPNDPLPQAVTDKLRERFPGSRGWRSQKHVTQHTVFELEGSGRHGPIEAAYLNDGTLLDSLSEVPPSTLPQPVQAALGRQLRDQRIKSAKRERIVREIRAVDLASPQVTYVVEVEGKGGRSREYRITESGLVLD